MRRNVKTPAKGKGKVRAKKTVSLRSGLDALVARDPAFRGYANLLSDPCRADIVCPPGQGQKGICQRFKKVDFIANPTGLDSYIYIWLPKFNYYYAAPYGSGAAYVPASSSAPNGPGASYLNLNARGFKPLAGCVTVSTTAPVQQAAGEVYASVIPYADLFLSATGTGPGLTPNAIALMLGENNRLGLEDYDVKWYPSDKDTIGYSPAATGAGAYVFDPDNHAVVIVVKGTSLTATVQFTTTFVVEWQPSVDTSITIPTSQPNFSAFTATDVVAYLHEKKPGWWNTLRKVARAVLPVAAAAVPYIRTAAQMIA